MHALLGIGGALLVAAFFALRVVDADAPGTLSSSVAATTGTGAVAPAIAALPEAEGAGPGVADETTLLLPDGSRIAALNGARAPKPLRDAWPAGVPWSPIVGIDHSPAGIDWYVHRDGSRSTTEMVWRSDLGRYDATTRLARPLPKAPKLPPQ